MRKNFRLKVASVVLAIALWLFVISSGQSEVFMKVPIEFKNIPQGLQIVKSESMTEAVLGIRGHERFLKNLTPDDVHIYLDIGGVTEGQYLYNIQSDDIKLPVPLELSNINPSSVKIIIVKEKG